MDINRIRNFSIIAHIDHGKSTLADRLLEHTQTIEQRKLKEQILDNMDLERERGITIKAHPIRIEYKDKKGDEYVLNLIDTPGHVDFSYEVSKSLAACEGVLLLVDAAQGVQAQTVANVHLALEQDLVIIPVINKIDLPAADVDEVTRQLVEIIGLDEDDIILTSAKTGQGIEEILQTVVNEIPPPKIPEGDDGTLKALIFDSVFDNYRGVVVYMRLISGMIKKNQKIKMMASGNVFEVREVGHFKIDYVAQNDIYPGEVGYLLANIKEPSDVKVGDTITDAKHSAKEPLPGYHEVKPMVFAGLYPINSEDYDELKKVLHKFHLNDSSFVFEAETSVALGFGFRCGFLGLLHMEIVQERLEREYGMNILMTAPNVNYRVTLLDGKVKELSSPVHFPPFAEIDYIEEPMIESYIMCPNESMSMVMQLAQDRRGECIKTETIDRTRIMLTFIFPLGEVVIDFYDKLKSCTRGYGSFDYEHTGYRKADVVKLDILLNAEPVDAFSTLVHRSKAEFKGRQIALKLKDLIPRQLFSIPIQAVIGGKVIARETIRALKKDVTAKCYGGDISRKRKLWEKQKEGKKRMKEVGKVSIPQTAFIDVLKMD